ncbi:MAG: regulatory protein RecX [Desulfobacterales bacterium]
MPVITRLKVDRASPGRMQVTVDDRLRLSLPMLMTAALEVGKSPEPEDLERMICEDALFKARRAALKDLSARPRSREEIRRRLKAGGFPESVVEAVLDRLASERYIDDSAFAREWAAWRSRNRPRSRLAVRAELKRKGVAESAITEALEGWDDAALALACLEKKYRKRAEPWTEKDRRSAFDALRRKGFSTGTALEAIGRYEECRRCNEGD